MLGHKILVGMQGRVYSTAAMAAANTGVPTVSAQALQVQRSPGGLVVASEDDLGSISRVMAVVKAGARCEGDMKGVTHALRRSATLSTMTSSGFMMEKRLQQMGANLCVTGTREHLIYTIEVMRDKVKEAGMLLGGVVTQPIFKSWELNSVAPFLDLDREMADQDSFFEASEMIHKAAFRNQGLGNRLFSSKDLDSQLTAAMLEEYVQTRYTPDRMAVYGQNVGQEDMVDFMSNFVSLGGGFQDDPNSFKGGELRQVTLSPTTIAIIAGEGASLNSKQQYVFGVLEQVLGTGGSIKYSGGQGPLAAEVAKAVGDQAVVACFNTSYTDSGLFGVQVVGNADRMRDAVNGAFAGLASVVGSTGADKMVQAAKTKLKASLSYAAEQSSNSTAARAVSLISNDSPVTLETALKEINAVTTQQVQQAAKTLQTGKLAMAAIGNLDNTPYIDEIKR